MFTQFTRFVEAWITVGELTPPMLSLNWPPPAAALTVGGTAMPTFKVTEAEPSEGFWSGVLADTIAALTAFCSVPFGAWMVRYNCAPAETARLPTLQTAVWPLGA